MHAEFVHEYLFEFTFRKRCAIQPQVLVVLELLALDVWYNRWIQVAGAADGG